MKLRRIAALSAVLVLIGATAASAAGPPYTVSVGGNSAAGTEAVTATSTGPVLFNVRNNAGTTVHINCTSVSGSGTVTRGAGVNPVATITSTTWTGCRFPGAAFVVKQNGLWNVTGTGSNATPAVTDSIAGYISNVSAGFSLANGSTICSFTVTGQANGSFNEATQQLVINETGNSGDLVLSNVGPCLGQLQSGNTANFATTLNVNSPNGAINLS